MTKIHCSKLKQAQRRIPSKVFHSFAMSLLLISELLRGGDQHQLLQQRPASLPCSDTFRKPGQDCTQGALLTSTRALGLGGGLPQGLLEESFSMYITTYGAWDMWKGFSSTFGTFLLVLKS